MYLPELPQTGLLLPDKQHTADRQDPEKNGEKVQHILFFKKCKQVIRVQLYRYLQLYVTEPVTNNQTYL